MSVMNKTIYEITRKFAEKVKLKVRKMRSRVKENPRKIEMKEPV